MKKCAKPDCPQQKYRTSNLCRFHFDEKNECQEKNCHDPKKKNNRFCERHTFCPTPGCPNKRDIGNLHCADHRLCSKKGCRNHIYRTDKMKSTLCQIHYNIVKQKVNEKQRVRQRDIIEHLKNKNGTFFCNKCKRETPAILCENDRMWCRPCAARRN